MEKYYEFKASTVENAVKNGLAELGLTEEEAVIEVVSNGGIFSRAVVRITPKVQEETLSEDEYAVYRAVLADDFAVFDAVSSLAASCYRMMREHNLFSHRILYPRMEEYMILPASDGDTGVKYVEYNHIYVH